MADVDPLAGNNPDADEEVADDGRPEWLPENFRSPEDLVKSYNEAQSKIRDQGTQLNALNENYAEISSRLEEVATAQSRPDPNQVYSQWQDLFDQDPIGTVARIAEATAQQVHQQYASQQSQPGVTPDVVAFIADQTLGQQFPDWQDYKAKVGELIAEDPLYQREDLYANPDIATRALTSAYERVKAKDVLSGDAVLQQQQADTRAMKLAAQTAAGASGRPQAPSDEAAEWAAIMAARPKNYWE